MLLYVNFILKCHPAIKTTKSSKELNKLVLFLQAKSMIIYFFFENNLKIATSRPKLYSGVLRKTNLEV